MRHLPTRSTSTASRVWSYTLHQKALLSIAILMYALWETLVLIPAVNWLSSGNLTANNIGRALTMRCDWLLTQTGDINSSYTVAACDWQPSMILLLLFFPNGNYVVRHAWSHAVFFTFFPPWKLERSRLPMLRNAWNKGHANYNCCTVLLSYFRRLFASWLLIIKTLSQPKLTEACSVRRDPC